MFLVGAVILVVSKWRKSGKDIALLLLIEYLFLIYSSTVFLREDRGVIKCELIPFWSYGRPDLLVENIMNVVVFVPVGLLLSCVSNRSKWWMVLLIGTCMSVSIEVLQFVFKKGFAEVDDVMHNTFGCMIGISLANIPMFMIRKLKKR